MNGIDIASYQKGIDLGVVPCDFVIIKATQGVKYKNPDFDRAYENAKANKKCIGFYHYASQGGAEAEAQHFLDVVGDRQGILVLDWEAGDNVNWGNITYARKWLEYVEKKARLPFIYMSKSVCREYNWSIMAKYPLWVAQYANNKQTGYQSSPWTDNGGYGAWKGPKIFQYSSKGQLPGWSGNLDLNVAYMTKAEWNGYASGKAAAEPEKDPFKPYAGIVNASALRVRTGPGTSYGQKQVAGTPMFLPFGMVIAIVEEQNGWGRVNDINGWVSLEYLTR